MILRQFKRSERNAILDIGVRARFCHISSNFPINDIVQILLMVKITIKDFKFKYKTKFFSDKRQVFFFLVFPTFFPVETWNRNPWRVI